MKEPVLAPDGYTYEKHAIEAWLNEHGTSPQTRQFMGREDLVPNRALKDLIEHQAETEKQITTAANGASHSNPKPACSDELYKTLTSNTDAKVRKNSYKPSQSIVHVKTPNISDTTAPSHICCVIDVSGSMQINAACKDENGLENDTGLSIMDVVKFATLVISKSLRDEDKLSIVTYSNDARTVLQPTNMNEAGKSLAEKVISQIRPLNMTNLWAGAKMGIELAHEVGSNFINSVFLLTDGIPNVDPPLGYERSLKSLLKKSPLFGSFSTFGFGYNLHSQLLSTMSRIGGGYMSFIPDAGFVGTCFINAIANARCAFGINPYLRLKKNGDRLKGPTSPDKVIECNLGDKIPQQLQEGETLSIKMTPLRFGACMDIILDNNFSSDVELVFEAVGGREIILPVVTDSGATDPSVDVYHSVRSDFVQKITGICANTMYDDTMGSMFKPSDEITSARAKNKGLDALCKDMEGQATEAVSKKEWYERWGRHYLLSLGGAHQHQFCNNFKDPGVQVYGDGAELFVSLQDDLNEIFEKIPPPKPRARSTTGSVHSSRVMASMSRTYNNRHAVCVHGETAVTIRKPCIVDEQTMESVTVPIKTLKKGDSILTEDGKFVRVECVVETVTDRQLDLIKIGNLLVTPYHPVKTDLKRGWEFPVECVEGELVANSKTFSVYNLVLEEGFRESAIMMESIPCITLGHGRNDDEVLRHEYFGTDRVVLDLQKIKTGWSLGHIILRESDVVRKNGTGDICRISLSNSHTDAVNLSHVLCKA